MVSELITFDGGLSTKTSSHLIQRNEAIICQNVDLESGTLKPLPSLSFYKSVEGKDIHSFNYELVNSLAEDDDRHYAEYGNVLYWTSKDYTNYGLMKYDGTNGGTNAVAPDGIGSNIALISIEECSSTDGSGNLTLGAEYYYAFTLVNEDGIESIPTFHTTVIILSNANKRSIKISLSKSSYSALIPNGYTMNIYRQGGDNPTFNIIAEGLTLSSLVDGDINADCGAGKYCYRDVTADIDVSRIELTTFDNYSPLPELDMLIENQGTFFASFKKKVYFSRVGNPEYWNRLDFVVLDDVCTGLGKFANYILAFTRTTAYLIQGNTRDNISLQRLPFNQGCVDKHTIANIEGYLLWTSLNGICIYDGGSVRVITKKTLAWDEFGRISNTVYDEYDDGYYNDNGKPMQKKWDSGDGFNLTYATSYQDKYFASYNNGVAIIDLSNGLKVSTIYAENIVSVSVNKPDNYMYVVAHNPKEVGDVDYGKDYDVYIFSNSGYNMTATWKTGRLSEGSVNVNKHYRSVELDGTATNVKVFVNGILKLDIDNKNKFMLPSGCIGKDIQFEISTITEVRGLKYEYTVLKA